MYAKCHLTYFDKIKIKMLDIYDDDAKYPYI